MIVMLLGILLIALGWRWAVRIEERNNDGDYGDAIAAVALIALGIVVLVVRALVFIATHVHWGW